MKLGRKELTDADHHITSYTTPHHTTKECQAARNYDHNSSTAYWPLTAWSRIRNPSKNVWKEMWNESGGKERVPMVSQRTVGSCRKLT